MTTRDLLEGRCKAAARRSPCPGSFARRLLAAMAALMLLSGFGPLVAGRAHSAEAGFAPSIRATDLLAIKERCGPANPVKESLQLAAKHAFGGPEFKTKNILAFEENRYFIYAVGVALDTDGDGQAGNRAKGPPRLVRRFILLKPSTMVVNDLVRVRASAGPTRWLLYATGEPKIDGQRISIPGARRELVCESLLPGKVTIVRTRRTGAGEQAADDRVEVLPQGAAAAMRFLHVFRVAGRDDESSGSRSELVEKDGRLRLTVTAEGRVFRLFLRPGGAGADEIEVAKADGQTLLTRRLLPAGILPHGPEGTRLLERWDSAYRGDRRPGWDTGRPSSELKKAVEEGTLKPCRAVVLGCGLGTNAVYLAGKGFDVTGIDIAPTALSRAEEKARKAGVKVRWLLADVLAPADLDPFELIYDRGCYHGVRRQNAAGYVKTVCRLSRPGTRLLLLAGNANEAGRGGPPRIKEEEIRDDFSESFDFEWLRETRFDTRNAAAEGPLAWSALLRRKKQP